MKPLHLAAVAAASLGAAAACGTAHDAGTGGAPATTTTASTTTASTATHGSGGAGGCGGSTEVFGACGGSGGTDGGTAKPGDACQTAADCRPACCPCAHGQTQYTYSACTCGKCASICDPVNDTRAPVCQDAGPTLVGCLTCSQILLNVALSDGDQLGPLACQGAATTGWAALSACVTSACGSVCSGGVMPTNACVTCFEQSDAMGGCASELAACSGE